MIDSERHTMPYLSRVYRTIETFEQKGRLRYGPTIHVVQPNKPDDFSMIDVAVFYADRYGSVLWQQTPGERIFRLLALHKDDIVGHRDFDISSQISRAHQRLGFVETAIRRQGIGTALELASQLMLSLEAKRRDQVIERKYNLPPRDFQDEAIKRFFSHFPQTITFRPNEPLFEADFADLEDIPDLILTTNGPRISHIVPQTDSTDDPIVARQNQYRNLIHAAFP